MADAHDLAELADLAYFEVDADRNLISVSPALERLTGFAAEEVLGRSCLTVNRCEECIKGCGVFKQGEVDDIPIRLYGADGSDIHVIKSGRVYRDEAGEITGAIEVLRPVFDEVTGAQRRPVLLDTLLRGLGRIFVVTDANLRVVSHSEALPATIGVADDKLRGVLLPELLGDELFGPESSFQSAVLAGERREGWRAYLTNSSGEQIPVSVSIGPIEEPDACGVVDGRYIVMIRLESEDADPVPAFQGMVSRSPAMQRIFRVIELLRHNDSTVLITGESGTGKELVARALHDTSHRSDGPFVAVNCAAIPSELLESELFGHVRGAFTGAVRDRPGRFELADGGTLFLDEIGDLALSLQSKLLRFLQEHTFERVGESRTRSVDIRVIAATHVNLVRAVAERRFREDLYYRLRVVPIEIPPLRERREDLELLIRHFLDQFGRERGRALRLAPSASRALLTYAWPGNVRELVNTIEYATTVCEGQTIHMRDLPVEIGRHAGGPTAAQLAGHFTGAETDLPDSASVPFPLAAAYQQRGLSASEMDEAGRIRAALEATRYNRNEAAERLGVSRTTLWRKMKRYDL
ncbi:MAG: sigma 54-interacting transcriptional regulator [Gemmatimonadota bacterium]